MQLLTPVTTAVVLAVGITAAGFFIGDGVRHIQSNNRTVNVRGLSEREVQADTARITLGISRDGSSPAELFPLLSETQNSLITALKDAGISESEILPGQWTTQRTRAEELKLDPTLPLYNASGSLTIKTTNVAAAEKIGARINELQTATQGAISYSEVAYSFNGISGIRAEMIAAATKDARNAALQFAADSGSKVGSISNASQGMFQIWATGSDHDDPTAVSKTVRVVTTVTYELLD